MLFRSTRGGYPVSFCEAVAQGLAPDGGLYLPEEFPDLNPKIKEWEGLDYPALCIEFFRYFATDLSSQELEHCVNSAYTEFSDTQTAPLIQLSENWKCLELFHGPTLAFKDFALQLLGNLYEAQIARDKKDLCVLGATSGDTGAAAISGLLGKEGVKVFILYPKGKVSPLQEMQMTCTGAKNVQLSMELDDAQRIVKELFADLDFRKTVHLSAVNSLIWHVFSHSQFTIYMYG